MVPHVAARKTHQRLLKFSFVTPKRLLQQYLPKADVPHFQMLIRHGGSRLAQAPPLLWGDYPAGKVN
jgi:hypothetical protein